MKMDTYSRWKRNIFKITQKKLKIIHSIQVKQLPTRHSGNDAENKSSLESFQDRVMSSKHFQ